MAKSLGGALRKRSSYFAFDLNPEVIVQFFSVFTFGVFAAFSDRVALHNKTTAPLFCPNVHDKKVTLKGKFFPGPFVYCCGIRPAKNLDFVRFYFTF